MYIYTYKLRNGYYPSFFYPALARVSKSYYSLATQAFFVRYDIVYYNVLYDIGYHL